MVNDHESEMNVEQESQRLAKLITAKVTTLLEVIESMGASLNSEDSTVRKDSLETLAEVLRLLPNSYLNELEVSSLLNYFSAQLKGHPETARVAIFALKALFEQQPVRPSDTVIFVERFFNETELVDLTKDDKMCLYRIFHTMLTKTSYLSELKTMHSAFIPGFLQLVELETDPQCLMLCFSMFQIVVRHFTMGVYVDDMFEFPASYFPIDFNAPPERHGGVTRANLQEAVEKCLLSHDSFAEHVIKLCLEKISSEFPEAQIDGLQLLRQAIHRYDSAISSEYLGAIWSLVRKLHIGHSEESRYQEALLRTTTILAQKLNEAENGQEELERFADMMWKDFEDNEAFLDYSGWRFTVAFAGSSSRSAQIVLPKCLHKVTSMLNDEKQVCTSLLNACSALVSLLSMSELTSTTRPAVEMLIAQGCTLLLNPSFSDHLSQLVELLEIALPLPNVFGNAQIESIGRFIESSISTKPKISPVLLKKFIASCNSHFDKTFSSRLQNLARTFQCVWLLAGLVEKTGENAEQICQELLDVAGSSAFEAVREILLTHPKVSVIVLDRLLNEKNVNEDSVDEFEDLLTVAVREVEERVVASKLRQLCDKLSGESSVTVLIQLRVLLSNCQRRCLDSQVSCLSSQLLNLESSLNSTACQCLALIANKFDETSDDDWKTLESCLSSQNPECVAYIAKGLLMRGHKQCEHVIDLAIRNITVGSQGPKAFALIAKPEPKIFPRDGHCIVRILYPQRLLTLSMRRLLSDFDRANDTDRALLATAICLMIQNVSPDLAAPYLVQLRPMLQWCLGFTALSADSSRGLLQCLRRSLPQLELNVNVLLPPLLRWSERPHPMDLRVEALLCIDELRKYFEAHSLLPHKKRVLKSLPVGDRKRLIRKAASKASVAWHMLGEA